MIQDFEKQFTSVLPTKSPKNSVASPPETSVPQAVDILEGCKTTL